MTVPGMENRSDIDEPTEDAVDSEKRLQDATDGEHQSSDDEAPEEVSTAAAAALAGHRRNAEQKARRTAGSSVAKPKRKRLRKSKGTGEDALPGAVGGETEALADVEAGADDGIGLPSDLLLEVKSGALKRMQDEASIARRQKEIEEAEPASHAEASLDDKGGHSSRRKRASAGLERSDNFRLVVLGADEGGAAGGADSKAQATKNAQNFLRERTARQKRVSHGVFKARKRLGPSPKF